MTEPVRFNEWVDRTLYDPETGFYGAHGQPGGRSGDFTTSPETGPLFAEVLANRVAQQWRACGEPADFDIIEVGSGRARLVAPMLAALRSRDGAAGVAWRYRMVERSARLRAGYESLGLEGVTSSATLPDPVDHGAVIANELLDNVAWRVVEFDGSDWRELLVLDDAPTLGDRVDDPRLAGLDAVGGQQVPLLDAAATLIGEMIDTVGSGAVMCIDYGVRTTAELMRRDWCRTYVGHERGFDPFDSPGARDITIDVPFDQLPPPTSLTRQADALVAWGLDDLVAEGRRTWAERAHIGDLPALRARSRVAEADALTDPDGLGAFWVAEWSVGPT